MVGSCSADFGVFSISSDKFIIKISKKDEASARRRGKRKLSERERDEEIRKLEKQMQEASRMLEFEYAAILRDRIIELRKENTK